MKKNITVTFVCLSIAFLFVSSAETKRGHNSLFAVADLSVTKVDTPDPVQTGSNLTYTITVTNNGPDAAANASWSDIARAVSVRHNLGGGNTVGELIWIKTACGWLPHTSGCSSKCEHQRGGLERH